MLDELTELEETVPEIPVEDVRLAGEDVETVEESVFEVGTEDVAETALEEGLEDGEEILIEEAVLEESLEEVEEGEERLLVGLEDERREDILETLVVIEADKLENVDEPLRDDVLEVIEVPVDVESVSLKTASTPEFATAAFRMFFGQPPLIRFSRVDPRHPAILEQPSASCSTVFDSLALLTSTFCGIENI